MKAVACTQYGSPDVLKLRDIEEFETSDDVLTGVRAAGVSHPDGIMTRGVSYILRLFAVLRRPGRGVRGTEVAGTVAEDLARRGEPLVETDERRMARGPHKGSKALDRAVFVTHPEAVMETLRECARERRRLVRVAPGRVTDEAGHRFRGSWLFFEGPE
jgi:hypothetical protein